MTKMILAAALLLGASQALALHDEKANIERAVLSNADYKKAFQQNSECKEQDMQISKVDSSSGSGGGTANYIVVKRFICGASYEDGIIFKARVYSPEADYSKGKVELKKIDTNF